MTYDHWKTTDPADEWLGPKPLEDDEMDEAINGRILHNAYFDLPQNHYRALLVDPPWVFETWSDKGRDRSAEKHYKTMTLLELTELPVQDLAARDALLFLWSSGPMLPQSLALLHVWGFQFSTVAFVWEKQNQNGDTAHGLGYWSRSNCEFVILGKRGSPKRRAKDVPQLIKAPKRAHSEKPAETIRRIERLVAGPYVELFARRTRRGWDVWGDEVGKLEAEP